MHKWAWHTALQLDDGEAECANSYTVATMNGAAPLELGSCSQAELMGKVPLLVVVLTMLVLVQSEEVCAVLVYVVPVFTFLAKFEQVVQIHHRFLFRETQT